VAVRHRTVFSAIVYADGGCGAVAQCQGVFMDGGQRPRAIALTGERASGGLVFARFGGLAAAADRVAFGAHLADPDGGGDEDPFEPGGLAERRGIFTASSRGIGRLAITGRSIPQVGTGGLSPDPTALVASGRTVFFTADIVQGQETGIGLFSGRPGRLTLTAGGIAETPGALEIQGIELHQEFPTEGAGAARGLEGVTFLASTAPNRNGVPQQALLLRRRGRLIPLATTGERTALGGTLARIGLASVSSRSAVYRADLTGASARAALFAVEP
jgi:hypothetical protein